MRIKKMAAVLVAFLALTALSASAAHAAWSIQGVELGAAVQEDVKYEAMTPFTLTSTLLGAAVEITVGELECYTAATCSIDGSNFGTDHSTAQLTFKRVGVDKPAGCSVVGGAFTTSALTDSVIMDPGGGLQTFDEFRPEPGHAIAEMVFSGALCPIAENAASLKGNITGTLQMTNTSIERQAIDFGAAEQATGGGVLKFGNEAATLTGEATFRLNGGNKGKVFSAGA